jgi:diketogulonate reductase-like aldo/keto reductase
LQILLEPYVWAKQKPIVDFAAENDIIIEGYSPMMYVLPAHIIFD